MFSGFLDCWISGFLVFWYSGFLLLSFSVFGPVVMIPPGLGFEASRVLGFVEVSRTAHASTRPGTSLSLAVSVHLSRLNRVEKSGTKKWTSCASYASFVPSATAMMLSRLALCPFGHIRNINDGNPGHPDRLGHHQH